MNYQGNNNNMEKEQVKPVDKTVVSKKNNRRRTKKVIDRTIQNTPATITEVTLKTINCSTQAKTLTFWQIFVPLCKRTWGKFTGLFKK